MAMKTTKQQQTNLPANNRKKNIISGIVILILLMIALFAYRDSFEKILKGIMGLSPCDIIVSSLFSLLFFLMEGTVIYTLAVLTSAEYQRRNGIKTAFLCEFYRLITFGSGTGIAQIHYLHKDGVEPAIGTGISILQFVMKKISIMILGLLSFILLYFSPSTHALCIQYLGFLIAGCLITTAIALFLLSVTLSEKVMRFACHLTDKLASGIPSAAEKITLFQSQIRLLNDSGRKLFCQKNVMLKVIVCNLVKLVSIYTIPAYLLHGSWEPGIAESIALMAAVYMLAGVIPAPSGIGSLEFVYLLLFGAFAEPEITVPPLFIFRFVTWILPFIAGGILYLIDRFS